MRMLEKFEDWAISSQGPECQKVGARFREQEVSQARQYASNSAGDLSPRFKVNLMFAQQEQVSITIQPIQYGAIAAITGQSKSTVTLSDGQAVASMHFDDVLNIFEQKRIAHKGKLSFANVTIAIKDTPDKMGDILFGDGWQSNSCRLVGFDAQEGQIFDHLHAAKADAGQLAAGIETARTGFDADRSIAGDVIQDTAQERTIFHRDSNFNNSTVPMNASICDDKAQDVSPACRVNRAEEVHIKAILAVSPPSLLKWWDAELLTPITDSAGCDLIASGNGGIGQRGSHQAQTKRFFVGHDNLLWDSPNCKEHYSTELDLGQDVLRAVGKPTELNRNI